MVLKFRMTTLIYIYFFICLIGSVLSICCQQKTVPKWNPEGWKLEFAHCASHPFPLHPSGLGCSRDLFWRGTLEPLLEVWRWPPSGGVWCLGLGTVCPQKRTSGKNEPPWYGNICRNGVPHLKVVAYVHRSFQFIMIYVRVFVLYTFCIVGF